MQKDPAAVLDFKFDWDRSAVGGAAGSGWLASGETITTSTWTIETKTGDATPLAQTTPAPSIPDGKACVIWLTGGTAGLSYRITNRVTTNQGRTDERTRSIEVRDR